MILTLAALDLSQGLEAAKSRTENFLAWRTPANRTQCPFTTTTFSFKPNQTPPLSPSNQIKLHHFIAQTKSN
jgi:hypothetical protein